MSRRAIVKLGTVAAAGAAGVGSAVQLVRSAREEAASEVFRRDAPQGDLWRAWQERGWAREASYFQVLGRNVQCKLCPNDCLLEPEDRGRCRNRVHKSGKLWTLAYADPCALHLDPIEKKPLYHFLPGSKTLSLATAGCSLRCLNCQNWEISQRRPEETKRATGTEVRLTPAEAAAFGRSDLERATLLPEDAVALARATGSASIAYTYSEPATWFEYMRDIARLARPRGIRSVWVTSGYLAREPLAELAQLIDAANVDLKSYSESVYRDLNSGRLAPVLDTLRGLKAAGVWVEITNLIVPTHTDDLEMIRRMCDWIVAELGADVPLHFSRFHPKHKLEHLSPTPASVLARARDLARERGLRFAYVGNAAGIEAAGRTYCPGCRRAVVDRHVFELASMELRQDGTCPHCGHKLAGVWA